MNEVEMRNERFCLKELYPAPLNQCPRTLHSSWLGTIVALKQSIVKTKLNFIELRLFFKQNSKILCREERQPKDDSWFNCDFYAAASDQFFER